MTRRKRTPPSNLSSSQTRVSDFEIPASLQHFSTISRSLATTMAATSHSYSRNSFTAPQTSPRPRIANAPTTLGRPRQPTPQSSTHSASSLSNPPRPSQYGTPPSVPQKRSFSEYQSATRPPQRSKFSALAEKEGEPSSTLAEFMAKARAAVAASKLQPPPAPALATTSAPKPGQRPVPTNDLTLVAQMAAKQREENARAKAARNAPSPLPYIPEEPPLGLGEAPALTTHPNLIAQMVARKRAEAEMLGHRERWARRQHEYRMSSSPGAQLTHELNTQISHNDARQSQPRTVSNSLPARSVPSIQKLKPTIPIVFNAHISTPQNPPTRALDTRIPRTQSVPVPMLNTQSPSTHTPAAETVSTPATDESARPAAANIDQRPSTDNDSIFGSPFSSPIVEFLEKATDNAGLREALEPNEVMSNRTSVSRTTGPTSQPNNTENTTVSASAAAVGRSQAPSDIPPLFSDKPLNTQSQLRNPNLMPAHIQSIATHQQAQSNPSIPIPGQTSQAQPQQTGAQPQLAPRHPPPPRAIPYYPHQAGMPGYYRDELNQNWAGGGSNFVATPASNHPTPSTYPPVHPPQLGMGFRDYTMNPVSPYVVPQPGLPPTPGPLRTYGAAVAAAAAAQQQKHQATNDGYLTAADLVAGINLKFKNATQNGFSVPKR